MSFINNLSDFISRIKFKYSIVLILVGANIFLVIYPSMLKSISKDHWDLIKDVSQNFLMLCGMSIGFYFNKKTDNENVVENKTP